MTEHFQSTILRFDSIDSTNLEGMRRARAGAAEGLCVVAREQTSGRGRLDRSWQSPKDAGLYCSLVLRPKLHLTIWPLLNLMAALAVCDALTKACGLRADIKWPNDLCVNNLKLCGILAETVDTPSEKKDPVRQAVFDATRSVMEQLGRELSLCLRYQSVTFRGQRPTRLRLMGGEGADTHLQEILNSILTIPIEAPRPLYSIDSSKLKSLQRQQAMGEWALVLGLALRHTSGRFRPRDGRPRGPSAMGDVGAFSAGEPVGASAEVRASAAEPTAEGAVAPGAAPATNAPRNGGRNGEGAGAPYRAARQEAPHA